MKEGGEWKFRFFWINADHTRIRSAREKTLNALDLDKFSKSKSIFFLCLPRSLATFCGFSLMSCHSIPACFANGLSYHILISNNDFAVIKKEFSNLLGWYRMKNYQPEGMNVMISSTNNLEFERQQLWEGRKNDKKFWHARLGMLELIVFSKAAASILLTCSVACQVGKLLSLSRHF